MTDTERDELRDLQDRVIAKLEARNYPEDSILIADYSTTIRMSDLRSVIYPRYADQFSAYVRGTEQRPHRATWTR